MNAEQRPYWNGKRILGGMPPPMRYPSADRSAADYGPMFAFTGSVCFGVCESIQSIDGTGALTVGRHAMPHTPPHRHSRTCRNVRAGGALVMVLRENPVGGTGDVRDPNFVQDSIYLRVV